MTCHFVVIGNFGGWELPWYLDQSLHANLFGTSRSNMTIDKTGWLQSMTLTKTGMLPNVTQNLSAWHFSNLCLRNVETAECSKVGQSVLLDFGEFDAIYFPHTSTVQLWIPCLVKSFCLEGTNIFLTKPLNQISLLFFLIAFPFLYSYFLTSNFFPGQENDENKLKWSS